MEEEILRISRVGGGETSLVARYWKITLLRQLTGRPCEFLVRLSCLAELGESITSLAVTECLGYPVIDVTVVAT